MATYAKIQDWVKEECGRTPKTCWIAHCKELYGLPVNRAHNRAETMRKTPCPEDKKPAIFAAFQHFKM
ncbi:MAG: hypothetical protein OXE98_05090 [Hyphomicrobiales bacterium]|nr:hypothetical protein [Hyphomicrobiales bacterium]